jgi:hypothetical protein
MITIGLGQLEQLLETPCGKKALAAALAELERSGDIGKAYDALTREAQKGGCLPLLQLAFLIDAAPLAEGLLRLLVDALAKMKK